MLPIVTIRPLPRGNGFNLRYAHVCAWYAQVIHAIQYARELLGECEIIIYDEDGEVKDRYSTGCEVPEPPLPGVA